VFLNYLQVTGDAVRDLLKIPDGAAKFKYTQVDDFEVYVQSTSYNRVLMPDTKFLYEVKPGARGIKCLIYKVYCYFGP